MIVALDIKQQTKPLINRTYLVNKFVYFIFEKLDFVLDRFVSIIIRDTDNLILHIEGYYNYIAFLSPEEAKEKLISTKKAIKNILNSVEKLEDTNYLNNKELEEKYKYLLKSLYKLSAKLHKQAYKNIKTIPTNKELKDGVIRMNALHIDSLLSK